MSRFSLDLATEADDRDLREVIASTTMPGRVALSFRREPSYFAGAAVEGDWQQVVVARQQDNGRVVGFGSRSGRQMYVNGQPTDVGYISNLRLLPGLRGRSLLARGYRKLRELHADGRAKFYLTSIAEDNLAALQMLTSGRAALPAYHDMGRYHTLVIPIPRRQRRTSRLHARPTNVVIRNAVADDLPRVVAFLTDIGSRKQFFPCYAESDFTANNGTFRGLDVSDLLLAEENNRIVGVLGLWDQHATRQTVVDSYAGPLRHGRWLYNAWAWSQGNVCLPPPGSALRYLTAATPVVEPGRVDIMTTLIETATAQRVGGPWQYLLVGLHESDPRLPAVKQLAREEYLTRIFAVCWEDGEEAVRQLDSRGIYLELGCL